MGYFLPFYTTNIPKNENFKNINKTPGDIILHKSTKHHGHIYCSWDIANDACNFYFSFWAIFCPFTSLKAQKIKISKKKKKMKKSLEMSSFYTCLPKIMIISYTVPRIWCVTDAVVIFHFGLFFVLLPPNRLMKISKKWKKNLGDIII